MHLKFLYFICWLRSIFTFQKLQIAFGVTVCIAFGRINAFTDTYTHTFSHHMRISGMWDPDKNNAPALGVCCATTRFFYMICMWVCTRVQHHHVCRMWCIYLQICGLDCTKHKSHFMDRLCRVFTYNHCVRLYGNSEWFCVGAIWGRGTQHVWTESAGFKLLLMRSFCL